MKAYEFYILLGKYKRRSISPGEYERFRHAVSKVRIYRHAFFDSTGEYHPHFPQKTSSRMGNIAQLPLEQSTAISEHSPSDSVNKEADSQQIPPLQRTSSGKSDEVLDDILYQHREFRRVRSKRSKKKFRWYRLTRDIAKNHPFALFTMGVFVVAVLILVVVKPGFSSQPLQHRKDAQLEDLTAEAQSSIMANDSLTSSRFLSEADQLLAVDSKSFEFSDQIEEPIKVPITGLEQAIIEGLEARFPDPKEALTGIEFPEVVIPETPAQTETDL